MNSVNHENQVFVPRDIWFVPKTTVCVGRGCFTTRHTCDSVTNKDLIWFTCSSAWRSLLLIMTQEDRNNNNNNKTSLFQDTQRSTWSETHPQSLMWVQSEDLRSLPPPLPSFPTLRKPFLTSDSTDRSGSQHVCVQIIKEERDACWSLGAATGPRSCCHVWWVSTASQTTVGAHRALICSEEGDLIWSLSSIRTDAGCKTEP